MRPLTPAELARMSVRANAAMLDTCRIAPYLAGAKDGYNRPASGYGAPGPAVACTVLEEANKEFQPTGQQTPRSALRIRLPLGTAVGFQDRIQVTHRFGRPVTPPAVYRAIGQPETMMDAVEVPVEAV